MNLDIFYLFYKLSENPFMAKASMFLSYPFTYGILILLFIWAIFISYRKMFNFSILFLSGFISWLVAGFIKNTLRIKRPFLTENISPLFKESGFSFPSEHTAVFMGITIAMFLINKWVGFLFLIITFLIGISRMIIGVHYPSDIIGGMFVGMVIGLIFNEIFKKI